jgi:hypothetical protein
VIGLDARGETPNGELVRVTQLTLDGPDDPTHRPSRCCRERSRRDDPDEERREPTPHPGFDFGTWMDHVGTEQLCVVGFSPRPQRIDKAHPPAVRTPDGAVVQFYASCASADGTEHLRLFFTPETAAQALRVRRGAFVRGTLTGSGDLWVTRVSRTPSRYEDVVGAR